MRINAKLLKRYFSKVSQMDFRHSLIKLISNLSINMGYIKEGIIKIKVTSIKPL